MLDPTVQTIFILGFAAFSQDHNLPAHILRAAWCIMNCRSVVLGGHRQVCPDGHFERNHYNSCKHRICPLCAYVQVETWLRKQKERLLNCDHYLLAELLLIEAEGLATELKTVYYQNQFITPQLIILKLQEIIKKHQVSQSPKYQQLVRQES